VQQSVQHLVALMGVRARARVCLLFVCACVGMCACVCVCVCSCVGVRTRATGTDWPPRVLQGCCRCRGSAFAFAGQKNQTPMQRAPAMCACTIQPTSTGTTGQAHPVLQQHAHQVFTSSEHTRSTQAGLTAAADSSTCLRDSKGTLLGGGGHPPCALVLSGGASVQGHKEPTLPPPVRKCEGRRTPCACCSFPARAHERVLTHRGQRACGVPRKQGLPAALQRAQVLLPAAQHVLQLVQQLLLLLRLVGHVGGQAAVGRVRGWAGGGGADVWRVAIQRRPLLQHVLHQQQQQRL